MMKPNILPSLFAAMITACTCACPAMAQSQAASTLPGGASTLQETFQDWRVICEQREATKRCAFSQIQTKQDGRRVLAVEINAPVENTITGTLVLPFGLALASGAAFQIDDMATAPPLPFRTCLPMGCIVPLSFDAPKTAALRAGATLKVRTVSDDGRELVFSVSLRGFATALDRVTALAR